MNQIVKLLNTIRIEIPQCQAERTHEVSKKIAISMSSSFCSSLILPFKTLERFISFSSHYLAILPNISIYVVSINKTPFYTSYNNQRKIYKTKEDCFSQLFSILSILKSPIMLYKLKQRVYINQRRF